MRVFNLSKSMRDEVTEKIKMIDPGFAQRPKNLKIAELDNEGLAVIFDPEEKLYLGRNKGLYFPLLKDELLLPKLASATVDMGAIKFVTNGANIMRPGIVSFAGDFDKGALLVVKEVGHQKAIAVGRSLEARSALEPMKKGAALENLHYVGDSLWGALKSLE